jgi:hypothetical protein
MKPTRENLKNKIFVSICISLLAVVLCAFVYTGRTALNSPVTAVEVVNLTSVPLPSLSGPIVMIGVTELCAKFPDVSLRVETRVPLENVNSLVSRTVSLALMVIVSSLSPGLKVTLSPPLKVTLSVDFSSVKVKIADFPSLSV